MSFAKTTSAPAAPQPPARQVARPPLQDRRRHDRPRAGGRFSVDLPPHLVVHDERLGKLTRIEKHDPPGHARILGVIDRLLHNPADADGWVHGEYHGRLKKYVGRSEYRLIYHWCELCRKEGKKFEKQCGYCHEVADNSVIFFAVYHKNEASRV